MSKQIRKAHPLISVVNSTLVDMPAPSNINLNWNVGSLLGMCLSVQVVTGLFLAMHFSAEESLSFMSVIHIYTDVEYGWAIRSVHANGASLFFLCLYYHISRGLYFSSFFLHLTWMSGVVIMVLVMATAFVGYVLPWGQMSFWGATVIINLFSAVPYVGVDFVKWLWGGFSVGNSTLVRFFTFHFILPMVLMLFVGIHILFLHQSGSSNPLGINSNSDKIPFHPYFVVKDMMGFLLVVIGLMVFSFLSPYIFSDPENFIPANPMMTPPHIKPEWYFLFAYAVLRSIPSKLGGVVALFMSIFILGLVPFFYYPVFQSCSFLPLNKSMLFILVGVVLLLTWIGGEPVETPYVYLGQVLTFFYFFLFLVMPLLMKFSCLVFS